MLQGLRDLWSHLIADEQGLTTVEYALLLALLVVAGIGVWSNLETKMEGIIHHSGHRLDCVARGHVHKN